MNARFTTSTVATIAAANISIMDTFQDLYEYRLVTKCGIPKIIINGTVEDWKKIDRLS